MRGNCSFPPGNGSSDVGNGDFNCRKINFDAWCDIFFLRFSHTVLQINDICNVICNSICNAIIIYLSVCYSGFVADGRCFLFFKLYCRDFHLSCQIAAKAPLRLTEPCYTLTALPHTFPGLIKTILPYLLYLSSKEKK